MKHSEKFLNIVNAARKKIRECDIHAVKKRLDAGENLQLIDVREESEWNLDHLPKACHLGKGIIERDIESRFPDANRELILYCGGGYRSALAAENLQRMGYTQVISMDGGIRAWREAGYPLEK